MIKGDVFIRLYKFSAGVVQRRTTLIASVTFIDENHSSSISGIVSPKILKRRQIDSIPISSSNGPSSVLSGSKTISFDSSTSVSFPDDICSGVFDSGCAMPETLKAFANNVLRTFSVPLIVVPAPYGLDVGAEKCIWGGSVSIDLTFDVGTVDNEVTVSVKTGECCPLPLRPRSVSEIGVAVFVLRSLIEPGRGTVDRKLYVWLLNIVNGSIILTQIVFDPFYT
jgi:hypothetical protein